MNDVQRLNELNTTRATQCSRAIQHMASCARDALSAHTDDETPDRVRAYVSEVKRWADFVMEDLTEADVSKTASQFSSGKQRTA